MERGKQTWEDKIVITKDEATKKPIVEVEGLWTGKDRFIINRMLHRNMRKARYDVLKSIKKESPPEQSEGDQKEELKKKRLEALAKAREAKKLKKLEEEKKDVRGQQQ